MDLARLEHYEYRAIKRSREIRILFLLPGLSDDDIHCTLKVVDIDKQPSYEALSYTWGDPAKTKPIRCGSGMLDVTENLYDALKRLRDPSIKRVLWIDAICINQKDDIEKESQVQFMADIYSKASKLVIWIGEETESVAAAFDALRMTRALFPDENAVLTFTTMTAEQSAFYGNRHREWLASGELSRIFTMWEPVFELVQRPWFSRKWIIQEVVRGPGGLIVCGSHTLSWDVLEDTFAYVKFFEIAPIWNNHLTVAAAARFVHIPMIAFMRYPESDLELAELIHDTRGFAVTRARDHIMSVLRLASDLSNEDLTRLFDNTSTSTTNYLQAFAHWSIESKKCLVFLNLGFEQANIADPSQPSWIPNLGLWDGQGSVAKSRLSFKATLDFVPLASFTPKKGMMSIAGTIVDEVAVLGVPFSSRRPGYDDLEPAERTRRRVAEAKSNTTLTRDWLLECKEIAGDGSNNLDAPGFQGFCNVLSWETIKQFPLAQELSPEYIREHMAEWLDIAANGKEDTTSRIAKVNMTVMGNVDGLSTARRFSRTAEGRLGSMPKYCEVGDKICLLYGGNYPYVIRSKGDGTYTYIGDCYLDGVMYGEAMVEGRKEEMFNMV